jgi:hypothetical protein
MTASLVGIDLADRGGGASGEGEGILQGVSRRAAYADSVDTSAIVAAPNDLSLRRALAVELEAAGDPRGRFIHVQLDAARERLRDGASREYDSLLSIADALLEEHGDTWARDVAPLVEEARFYRGFVESVTVDARAFLARGAALLRLAPIRSVTLKDVSPVLAELLESPLLGALAHLGLQKNELGDDGVSALASCERLTELRLLDVSFNGMTNAGVDAIAASKHLARLVFVNLWGNPCDDPVETYGIDPTTGSRMTFGGVPPMGRAIESKYGTLPWLHAPSVLLAYPPTVEDV